MAPRDKIASQVNSKCPYVWLCVGCCSHHTIPHCSTGDCVSLSINFCKRSLSAQVSRKFIHKCGVCVLALALYHANSNFPLLFVYVRTLSHVLLCLPYSLTPPTLISKRFLYFVLHGAVCEICIKLKKIN